MCEDCGEKRSYEKDFKSQQQFTSHLRTFGKFGSIVLSKKKIKSKLTGRGFRTIFVGYAVNHAGDVYKMFNPVTSKVTLTRDVRFLGKYCGESKNSTIDDEEPEIDDIGSEDDAPKKVTFAPEIVN